MLAVVAPGQGAQAPGMLTPWFELDGVLPRLHWLAAVADLDLVALGSTADADTVRDTAVAQPLLVAAGLVALERLLGDPLSGTAVGVAAGHSVGEITACVVAGVLSPEQAICLVRERGRAMAEAAVDRPTGMTAVLGGDPTDVLTVLQRHGLSAANVNGAGQVVAAGTREQLAALAQDPPAAARLRPLDVAGAFHTEHMAPAVDRLRMLVAGMTAQDPTNALLSNQDGSVVATGRDMLARLVEQVSTPVRWDACQATMGELGVTGLLELAPAGPLTGLARRTLPGVATFALRTPDQLDDARAFVAQHSEGQA
jgi:[acyl-carrier-protein] S-malonyltransferase